MTPRRCRHDGCRLAAVAEEEACWAHLTDHALAALTLCEAIRGGRRVGAVLPRLTLHDEDLAGGNLSDAVLAQAVFADCRFRRARFDGADLRHATFHGCDLRGASFVEADLTGARLSSCQLAGADLSGANLTSVYAANAGLERAVLREARLSHAMLAGARLIEADLRSAVADEVVLSHADLSGANLWEAVLGGAILTSATLRGASLQHASLVGAVLCWADCSEADFSHARPGMATFRQASLRDAKLTGAICRETDFSGADLTGADLTGAILQRARFHDARLDAAALHLVVADTGLGIADEQLRRAFEPFSQVDGSSTRKHGGAGLGLAIVRRLVNLMQGTLAFCSEPGKGTEAHLTLYLPLAAAQPKPAEPPRNEPAPSARIAGARVLVVEDEPVNRLAVTRMLQKLGLVPAAAASGPAALELLAGQPFDCVLMDIQMPEMDGVETTRRIRNAAPGTWNPRLPVLALTAHAMKGDRERFLAAGLDGYIAKPVDLDDLRRAIELALAGR